MSDASSLWVELIKVSPSLLMALVVIVLLIANADQCVDVAVESFLAAARAGAAGAELIERAHVETALKDHRHRNERVQETYREEILRGQLLIATLCPGSTST